MRILAVALVALFVSGCATTTMYDWGSYEQKLYESYKNPAAVTAFKASLEEQIASSTSSNQRVPPGIYAELGTLYLQEGNTNKAIELYKRERDAWPESKSLMDAMIASLERSQADRRGASL